MIDNSFEETSSKRQFESLDQDGNERQPKRSKNNSDGRGRAQGNMVVHVVLKNSKGKGAVIGKRGSTITDIRARCNVAFSISKNDSQEHLGVITGDPYGIARALSMCSEELSIAYDEEPRSIIILVDNKNLDCLNSQIEEIQERTRCSIYKSPNTIGSSSQNLVEVIGENFDDAITSVITALSEGSEPVSMPYTPGQGGENALDDAWGDLKRGLEKRHPRQNNRPRNDMREVQGGGRPYAQKQYGDDRPWMGNRFRPEFPPADSHQAGWGGGRGFNRSRGGGPGGFSQFVNRVPSESRQDGSPRGGRWAGPRQGPEGPGPALPELQGGGGFREERTIFVPTDMISEVIGKRGANIKQIRERTGAKIFIEKGREEDFSELKLIVSGDSESMAHAASLIHEFAPN